MLRTVRRILRLRKACPFPDRLFPFSGFANKNIQYKRRKSQAQKHQKCCGITAGYFQNLIGHSSNERSSHNGESHKGHIGRKILHSKERGCEGCRDGRTGAVGHTCQAQACNTQRQRSCGNRQQCNGSGADRNDICPQHGFAAADGIEERTG